MSRKAADSCLLIVKITTLHKSKEQRKGDKKFWPRSVDRSHDAECGVENLQIHFIFNLRAPAGSRDRHYGDADQVSRDVGVERDHVAQVGLDHRALKTTGEHNFTLMSEWQKLHLSKDLGGNSYNLMN